MIRFGSDDFAIEIEPKDVRGTSSEVMTLADLRICVGEHILTAWVDSEDRESFDRLPDVPIVDLAHWFASSWMDLIFGIRVPRAMVGRQVSLAQRWILSSSLTGPDATSTYEWASKHALEFAATDYSLPAIVFQRRDDYVEVSWESRPDAATGSSVVFKPTQGAVLVDVPRFVELCRSLMTWVTERLDGVAKDPRLRIIEQCLGRSASDVGKATLEGWFPNWSTARVNVPAIDLETLGRMGAATTPTMMFLRSAAGELPATEASSLLSAFRSAAASRKTVAKFPEEVRSADIGIDPTAPWASGYRLARLVRACLGVTPDQPFAIRDQLEGSGVRVSAHSLQNTAIEGACFLTPEGTAFTFYNPNGRLSRSEVGRRTTLAHEFCHLLFDARKEAMGQLDRRVEPSGAGPTVLIGSLLEKRANAFAVELLLPQEIVLGEASKGRLTSNSLRALARRYQVSEQVVRHQAENQDVRLD